MRVDVLVVGARCAGATCAALLARSGHRVLAVDRGSFPSDALSTHQIWPPGVAVLERIGVLDELRARGAAITRRVRLAIGDEQLESEYHPAGGVRIALNARRSLLDAVLVGAARAAGAEVRERVRACATVEDGVVTGAELEHAVTGERECVRADLVIGADGEGSSLARRCAREVLREDARTGHAFAYFRGIACDRDTVDVHRIDRRLLMRMPTDDGLVMLYAVVPVEDLAAARADLGARFFAPFAARFGYDESALRAALEGRVRLARDGPSAVRTPAGPGWALVGDAAAHTDPIVGHGIQNALADAADLAAALAAHAAEPRGRGAAFAAYARAHDERTMRTYRLARAAAALAPLDPVQSAAFAASLRAAPDGVQRYRGLLAGSLSEEEFFAAESFAAAAG